MALSVANLNEADIPGLAALITTELPPAQPATTITGNAARGEDYYVNICSACHSGNGQGNDALGRTLHSRASMIGISKSSYQSYLDGIRGTHPDDFYGAQMARLAPAPRMGDRYQRCHRFYRYIAALAERLSFSIVALMMRVPINQTKAAVHRLLAVLLVASLIGPSVVKGESPAAPEFRLTDTCPASFGVLA